MQRLLRHYGLLIAALLLVVVPGLRAQEIEATPRIAIISAFQPEWQLLLAQMEAEETHVVNGVEFATGKLAGRDVVLFLTGVSMVNASMNTQLLLDHFNVTHIIFTGIAGA